MKGIADQLLSAMLGSIKIYFTRVVLAPWPGGLERAGLVEDALCELGFAGCKLTEIDGGLDITAHIALGTEDMMSMAHEELELRLREIAGASADVASHWKCIDGWDRVFGATKVAEAKADEASLEAGPEAEPEPEAQLVSGARREPGPDDCYYESDLRGRKRSS